MINETRCECSHRVSLLRVSVDGAEGLAGRGRLGFSERSRPCPVPMDPPAAVELEAA